MDITGISEPLFLRGSQIEEEKDTKIVSQNITR